MVSHRVIYGFFTAYAHKILWLTWAILRIYCATNQRNSVAGKLHCIRGVEILIARLLSLGLLVGLSSVLTLGSVVFTAAGAAHPSWSGYAGQAKRPLFRPWSRYPRRSAALRWRPQAQPVMNARSAAASIASGVSSEPLFGHRSDAAWPMQPRRNPDWRFRPSQPGPGQHAVQIAGASERGHADRQASRLHAQFRPPRVKRQRSYEEMQSEDVYAPPVAVPGMVYGTLATAGVPGYGTHWPRW